MYIQSGVAQSVQRLGYELGDKRFVVRLPAGEGISFFFHQTINIGVWTSNSLPLSGGAISVLWRRVHEGNNSHPFCVEVNNSWSYTSTPPYAFLSWSGTFSPWHTWVLGTSVCILRLWRLRAIWYEIRISIFILKFLVVFIDITPRCELYFGFEV
jgi:hypothetical protein